MSQATDNLSCSLCAVASVGNGDTRASINQLTNSNEAAIATRLSQLAATCTLERVLIATVSSGALVGIALGAAGSKWWLLPSSVLAGFSIQLAARGWCPLVPLFRRLGFRTSVDIEQERYALKLLRGDFAQVVEALEDQSADADCILDAVRN